MILPINIHYSDRTILEDWIQPEPSAGIGHSLIIIGYGFGASPFDSIKEEPNGKDYFIVRDSFGYQEIHYNIAVDELLPIIDVYFSLGEISSVNEEPAFDASDLSPEDVKAIQEKIMGKFHPLDPERKKLPWESGGRIDFDESDF